MLTEESEKTMQACQTKHRFKREGNNLMLPTIHACHAWRYLGNRKVLVERIPGYAIR
jgi:hypothetical protein